MPSDPTVLAFDTSAAHCAAALLLEGQVHTRYEKMEKGQAERLIPLLQELLQEHDVAFSELTHIGVGVGPGNFTGIRIAVSAARGMSLALGIPAVGVSGFEAIMQTSGANVAAIPAPRNMAYVQEMDGAPAQLSREEVPEHAAWPEPLEQVAAITLIAANAPDDTPVPKPIYVRAADAAPAREAPPIILDDEADV
ncbi:MAG: tRNA (adenosine(37)-N6)-threonylcarbamoyltransferase complex dimerization subunit type 1 TsaB [Pseudomonadota bacterium]